VFGFFLCFLFVFFFFFNEKETLYYEQKVKDKKEGVSHSLLPSWTLLTNSATDLTSDMYSFVLELITQLKRFPYRAMLWQRQNRYSRLL